MRRTNINTLSGTAMPHTVSIIGSGNVATHMARALHAVGYDIRQVFSLHYDHAARLARQVEAMPVDQVSQLDPTADVYLLAVTDDAIYDLASALRPMAASHANHPLFLHTSGSTPADVLSPLSSSYGVVWSPQTFVRNQQMDYSQLPLCIEGSSPEVTAAIEQFFSSVSTHLFHLDSQQRRWAHLAAVMISNFGNAVNALAQEVTTTHGIDFSMLRPLAEATVEKMNQGPLWPQQTGPAIRRDQKTIEAQRQLLADQPQLLQLYNLLTDIIQQH